MSEASPPAKKSGGEGAPAWMATFADLSTLLLTFFVLLFTFADVDAKKFEAALGSIQSALGINPSAAGILEQTAPIPDVIDAPTPEESSSSGEYSMQEVAEEIERMVEDQNLEEQVKVDQSARGVRVQVEGSFFFNPGTADLRETAQPVLDQIGEIMNRSPYDVSIEGHTDNIPIHNRWFSSNWELSTARAYSALKYLEESRQIDTSRMQISGFAATRPIDTNETPEGRAKNRRVEFVFFQTDNGGEETTEMAPPPDPITIH